jgi:hypothetical protein
MYLLKMSPPTDLCYHIIFSSDCNKFQNIRIGLYKTYAEAIDMLAYFTDLTHDEISACHITSKSLKESDKNNSEEELNFDNDTDDNEDRIVGDCDYNYDLFEIIRWTKSDYDKRNLQVHGKCVYQPAFWIIHADKYVDPLDIVYLL